MYDYYKNSINVNVTQQHLHQCIKARQTRTKQNICEYLADYSIAVRRVGS